MHVSNFYYENRDDNWRKVWKLEVRRGLSTLQLHDILDR